MKRLVAFLGLLAGFACALAFACKSSPVDVDAGEALEAGMRGGPVVGSNPGQPFGPCPIGSDCYGSNWQNERTLFLQQIALALDAAAGPGSGIFLNDAGVLTLAVPYQPALDGGFPSASTGQFFVQLSIGPGAATITGDLHCSTATPGLCTLTAIQGVPVDGSGGAAGYVLTWVDGGWSPQQAAVANYGLDLAVNPDGGSGQVLVGITGNDGGAAIPVHVQGFAVDGLQPTWGVTIAAPADAATSPASILLFPAPPNAGAATTASGTPGVVGIIVPASLSAGAPAGLIVQMANPDGGGAVGGYVVAQISNLSTDGNGYLCLGYQDGGCNNGNYTLGAFTSNGSVAMQANGAFIELSVAKGLYTPLKVEQPSSGFSTTGGLELGLPQVVIQPTVTNPEILFAQRNGDTPTTPLQIIGQSGYALTTSNKDAGPVDICSGNAGGTGLAGPNLFAYSSLGAGYTPGTPNVCNQTAVVTRTDLQLLQQGTLGPGLATSCTLFADPGGTGECFGKDGTGTAYQLNRTFVAPASLPGIPAQGSNGVGELVADGPGATGGAYWLGSGGYVSEFAPGGDGNPFGSPFTTTANVIGGHTTAVGNFVTMQVPIPTGQSAAITLTVDGRVTVAGATSVVGDSVSLATFAAVTNPSGTPRPLGNTGTDQSWTSYDTSQTAEVTAIAASTSPGFFNIVVTQAGAPNVGATILWTMAYQARLY